MSIPRTVWLIGGLLSAGALAVIMPTLANAPLGVAQGPATVPTSKPPVLNFTPGPTITPVPPDRTALALQARCETPVPSVSTWTRWTAPDGSFSIAYPSNWTVSKTPTMTQGQLAGELKIVNAEADCVKYFTSHLPEQHTMLMVTITPNAKSEGPADPKNVIRQQPVEVAGRNATRTLYKSTEGDGTVGAIPIMDGSTRFTIVALNIDKPSREDLFDEFAASLRLGSDVR